MASRCAITSSRLLRHLEEFVGIAAGAGIGRRGEHVLGRLVVQRVIKQRDRARRIAERRMLGDVLDALAVDIDLAAVACSDCRNSAPVNGRFLPARIASGWSSHVTASKRVAAGVLPATWRSVNRPRRGAARLAFMVGVMAGVHGLRPYMAGVREWNVCDQRATPCSRSKRPDRERGHDEDGEDRTAQAGGRKRDGAGGGAHKKARRRSRTRSQADRARSRNPRRLRRCAGCRRACARQRSVR